MKHIILLLLSIIVIQGCSVYGGLTKCDGFDESGTRCTSLLSNLEYSKEREKGNIPKPANKQTGSTPDGILCNGIGSCAVQIDYALLDARVKNDEFARLTIDKKMGMAETDPVLRPAKTVKATIYPYSDGSKFYQLRHIWIKTFEEAWIVGNSMVVDSKGTVIMDKAVNINTVGASVNSGTSNKHNNRTDKTISPALGNSNKGAKTNSIENISVAILDNSTGSSGNDYVNDSAYKGSKAFNAGETVTINVLFLNVRQQASENSTIIGVVPAGGKLQILDEKDGKWQRVRVVYYPKNKLSICNQFFKHISIFFTSKNISIMLKTLPIAYVNVNHLISPKMVVLGYQ